MILEVSLIAMHFLALHETMAPLHVATLTELPYHNYYYGAFHNHSIARFTHGVIFHVVTCNVQPVSTL